MKILLASLFLITNLGAITITKNSDNSFELKKSRILIKEIFDDYARVKKSNIIYSADVVGKVFLYGVKDIKKEDLDLYISAVASEGGYTLLRNDKLNQIEVIHSRDIRYKAIRIFKKIENVPQTYNHYRFVYKLKYAEARQISRNFRPFMSRYGRIIDEKNANSIILSDTGKNIHRLYKILQQLDRKEFFERVLKVKKFNKKHKKEKVRKRSILSIIKDQHVLFLIAFTLMGGIIGFGISSHLNRKKMDW